MSSDSEPKQNICRLDNKPKLTMTFYTGGSDSADYYMHVH